MVFDLIIAGGREGERDEGLTWPCSDDYAVRCWELVVVSCRVWFRRGRRLVMFIQYLFNFTFGSRGLLTKAKTRNSAMQCLLK